MIVYFTKDTFSKYKLKEISQFSNEFIKEISQRVLDKETDDKLFEWGGKLFYFNRRKCLQVVNFASKLTIILIDVKLNDIKNVGNMIAMYLFKIYEKDKVATKLIEKYLYEHPITCFALIKDRGIISTLNHTQIEYLQDGYRLAYFIKDGILQSVELNKKINAEYLFTQKIDGKIEYIYPKERFKELLIERYK